MNLTEFVDLIIPRGGRANTNTSRQLQGTIYPRWRWKCTFIHTSGCKKEHIIDIVINSKVQRPGYVTLETC